ncbi:kinase-like protein, partial [Neolentinus lepideus HHB14362 ss-1]
MNAPFQSGISYLLVLLALERKQDLHKVLLKDKIVLSRRDPVAGGGFADIFHATMRGQPVAAKRPRAHLLPIERAVRLWKDLLREVVIWHSVRHDNILPFLGIDCDASTSMFCMVSPWMCNGTIMEFIRKHPNVDIWNLLLETAKGLAYLHQCNVVHGDLRGGNILIDDDGHARLADFGLASIADQTKAYTSTSARRGSAKWMAPELHFPSSHFRRTPASDIYAYGCVCIEVFTLEGPFPEYNDGGFLFELDRGIRLERQAIKSRAGKVMPDLLWHIIWRCCSSRSSDRPAVTELAS